MADFDTKAKRFSGMGLGLDEAPLLPDSDGSFSVGDRQHFLDAYSGIAFGAAVVQVGGSSGAIQDIAWQETAWVPAAHAQSSWSFRRLVPRRQYPTGGFA